MTGLKEVACPHCSTDRMVNMTDAKMLFCCADCGGLYVCEISEKLARRIKPEERLQFERAAWQLKNSHDRAVAKMWG